jgi:hypothetical protein
MAKGVVGAHAVAHLQWHANSVTVTQHCIVAIDAAPLAVEDFELLGHVCRLLG